MLANPQPDHPSRFRVEDWVQSSQAKVIVQGSLLEFKVKITNTKVPGSKRGTIKDLSPGARLRMMKEFHRIDFENHCAPLFMTLTYPDEVSSPDLDARNLHRQHMARHLERITKKHVPAAWRVEWQDRKSGNKLGQYYPHYHWLIFGHSFIAWQDVRKAWAKTIGHDGYLRTDIQQVNKMSAIQMYMAKYISKDCCPPSLVIAAYDTRIGKQYGWLRRDEIPKQPKHTYRKLSDVQRDAIMRLADEQGPWMDPGQERSFTMFGDVARDAKRILDGEALDDGQL